MNCQGVQALLSAESFDRAGPLWALHEFTRK
jgi:hypothetical protein